MLIYSAIVSASKSSTFPPSLSGSTPRSTSTSLSPRHSVVDVLDVSAARRPRPPRRATRKKRMRTRSRLVVSLSLAYSAGHDILFTVYELEHEHELKLALRPFFLLLRCLSKIFHIFAGTTRSGNIDNTCLRITKNETHS